MAARQNLPPQLAALWLPAFACTGTSAPPKKRLSRTLARNSCTSLFYCILPTLHSSALSCILAVRCRIKKKQSLLIEQFLAIFSKSRHSRHQINSMICHHPSIAASETLHAWRWLTPSRAIQGLHQLRIRSSQVLIQPLMASPLRPSPAGPPDLLS